MLVGRDGACSSIDALLDGARTSTSGIVVLRGGPGIGKTALIRYAHEQATGMRTLTTTGVESESVLAFGGLYDVLRPVIDLLGDIPPPQSRALAGSLSLGPPVNADRFTTCAATLSLLAAATDRSPVLVTVDDAQWVDLPSLEALLFAGRRLRSEGVAILLATRDDGGETLDVGGATTIGLAGLDPESTAALLSDLTTNRVSPTVARRLHEATAGNPLAIVETASSLTGAQLAGSAPLPDHLPARSVERAFTRRLATLAAPVRRALLVAAAASGDGVGEIERAIDALGIHPPSLDTAEEAGVIAIEAGRVRFLHPLMRSAAYHSAPATERRAAHRALANVVADEQGRDRRAWHLASAATGPDEEVARALEEAAVEAQAKGGHASAATTFERAARLSPDGGAVVRRLVLAAGAAHAAGLSQHALELLDEALERSDGGPIRAEIQQARGAIQTTVGEPLRAHRMLVEEATCIEPADPDRAAQMLTHAAESCFQIGRIGDAVATARRACAVARAGPTTLAAELMLCDALVLAGEPSSAKQLLKEHAGGAMGSSDSAGWLAMPPFAQMAGWLEEYDSARAIAGGFIAAARSASVLSFLPYTLAVLSEIDFRIGAWASARAGASESVELGTQTGQESVLVFSLVSLGRVEAARGRAAEARSCAGQALARAERLGVGSIDVYAGSLLGLLELGLGNPTGAIEHLEPLGDIVCGMGMAHPGVVQWAPDLVEAYVMTGRKADARRALATFGEQARRTDNTWAKAAAARCAGLLADVEDYERCFEEALRWHSETTTPFERARTEACLGERRRRAGRRAEAREPLRNALEVFDRLGAAPWSKRMRSELGATGERVRRRNEPYSDKLTPQELQVALVVADGATNREAAASLFLSPKTVEFHLGNVYRKLQVRSRSELVRLVTSKPDVLA